MWILGLKGLRKKENRKSVSRNGTWSIESAVHHLHHHATEDLLTIDCLILKKYTINPNPKQKLTVYRVNA